MGNSFDRVLKRFLFFVPYCGCKPALSLGALRPEHGALRIAQNPPKKFPHKAPHLSPGKFFATPPTDLSTPCIDSVSHKKCQHYRSLRKKKRNKTVHILQPRVYHDHGALHNWPNTTVARGEGEMTRELPKAINMSKGDICIGQTSVHLRSTAIAFCLDTR